jgi:predicted TIM-barrel fold metal-dependent hydrolase
MTAQRRFRIFDAHFHIIDPRFPLVANGGYLPPAFDWRRYQELASGIGIVGGAVVSASYHSFDQTYLLDALGKMGPSFVGVTQLPPSVRDEELLALDRAGVRALRFNVKRQVAAIADLESMARRVFDLVKWHTELYIESADLEELFDTLVGLPKISIDHLGLSKEGFHFVLRLAELGAQIKATGFGRVDLDIVKAIKDIMAANPKSLVFGTDLPGTRARRPFHESDLDLIVNALGEARARMVFHDNAAAFYRPRQML